jgi:hypothetical protein
VIEPLFGQPSAMGARPMASGWINALMSQQEKQELLTRPPEPHRGLPSPRQITHRFAGRIR